MITPADEVIDFLLSQPTLEQVLMMRPSEVTQTRLRYLLDGNRNHTLNDVEQAELEDYSWLEHFVRRFKIRAREKLVFGG